jgi:cytochrome b pre-mRNA-processing protein 3
MMFRFFRPKSSNPSIASLYGMIVAQARAAAFYRNYGVPDTVNGRFEMVVLHTVMVLRHLELEPQAVRELGQGIFDRFCADMDGSLREMGVGDLAVPDKMRKIGEAFYGRQSAYVAALEASDPGGLVRALARNVFGLPEANLGAVRLAAYVRAAADRLAGQDGQALGRGQLIFPDPGESRAAGATPSAAGTDGLEHPVGAAE